MDALGDGLVTMANGALTALDGVMSPLTAAVGVLIAGFAWLAVIELETLARQGTKPDISRH